MHATIWMARNTLTFETSPSEAIAEWKVDSFAMAVKGGMDTNEWSTFATREEALAHVDKVAALTMRRMEQIGEWIAEEIKADANGGTWCDSTDANGKACRMFVPNNDR